ncbi:T9SS type A sorting domain-containing protein [bacterium]|nr:MAG: T9SS type A sorting domain-containing protein [bacterium]
MKATKQLLLSAGLSLITLSSVHEGLTHLSNNTSTSYGLDKSNHFVGKKLKKELRKKARADYEWELMRDPATNEIPQNAKYGELEWKKQSQLMKTTGDAYTWQQAGPNKVGGRTRALAFDVTNANVLISGGVSGGIWKTTNKGTSWELKTPEIQNLNITTVAQDTRNGQTSTWYAATGELLGNSAGSPASGFRGYGIFKSTDNGESWTLLANTQNPDITAFNSRYDYISRIVVSPKNGYVFAASAAGFVLRSTDGGQTWTDVLGAFGDYLFVDVIVDTNGKLIACLSADGNGGNAPGLYTSTTDGSSWNNITPNNFPVSYDRVYLALAPSNQNTLYALLNGSTDYFFKINLSNNTSENRSAFMPNLGGDAGDFESQGGYNYLLAVHPTDENFVIMGGTNLYRSINGFSTNPFAGATPTQTEKDRMWMGGYTKDADSYALYTNHHPDQHAFVFDPSSLSAGFSGHDGGLSYTTNTKGSTVSWINMNNNYYVTQFYHGSISRKNGSKQLVGGAQDNGSPLFTVASANSDDASSGDGSYSYLGETNMYVSSQNGNVIRYQLVNGTYSFRGYINPDNAQFSLFIHPFEVDKTDDFLVYYPSGSDIFRTTNGGVTTDATSWINLGNTGIKARDGLTITAIESSVSPAHTVYFGGTNRTSNGGATLPPYIYKWTNADTSTVSSSLTEIELPDATIGAYVSDIAVNPENANEVLVTLSNYNILGIYYSNNGKTFVQVEGNLEGNRITPGPSIRSAAIATINGVKVYFVGTTTGIYSTTILNGNNTVWVAEASGTVGNAIVNTLSYRESDGHIAAFTHGRGAFYGEPNTNSAISEEAIIADNFELKQNFPNPFNPSTTISFELKSNANVQLAVYDITGRLVSTLLSGQTMSLGVHSVRFDASNLASGTYIYSLQVFNSNGTSFTRSKKMTLIK